MKKILFSSLCFCSLLFGQPHKDSHPFATRIPFETEVISIPRIDSSYTVYYTYKIPYELLVFERQNDSYIANFRIIVEINDENGKLVTRNIKDNKITVNNFEATNEQHDYLQDCISFITQPGDYKVSAIISDMNSSGERPLKPFDIHLKKEDEKLVLQPLVIEPRVVKCKEKNSFILANSGGNIPFSVEEFNLMIPLKDTSITHIDITLTNNEEEIYSGNISESFDESMGITDCEGNIAITQLPENDLTRNFVLKNINEKLNEGKVILNVKNEEKDIDEKIPLMVVWFNKPFSLLNPEKAIEYLNFIETDDVVDELLSADESDYPKVLHDYWEKYDPTPETSFNEIMFEYYSRVDYAIKEFSSISTKNGAKTDRGMVYIKFGEPDKIDRTSNSLGEVIEIWTYTKSQRQFTFIDKIGTGNFTLSEN